MKRTLSHIVAASENNIIGIGNALPWRLPNDFKYFKNRTWGLPIIMGRNTFESFKKPLAGRRNIVLTRKADWSAEGAVIVHTMDDALTKAIETEAREIFIIGGGEIFRETMDLIDRVYLTRVHTKLNGDTQYPELDTQTWILRKSRTYPADEKNPFSYSFELWERNRK